MEVYEMDLTTITQIDTTILFGIGVGIIIMSLATLYDRYTAVSYTHLTLPTNREV